MTHVEGNRNAYAPFVGKTEGKCPFKSLDIFGTVLLKWILNNL